jgi:hypothetical protein
LILCHSTAGYFHFPRYFRKFVLLIKASIYLIPKLKNMKNTYAMMAAVVMIAIAAMVVMMPVKAVSQKESAAKSMALPDSVNKIVMVACAACHATGGNGMAEAHWKADKWDTYTPDKAASKAEAMCKQVTKGSMPPKSFKESHKDAVLTPQQVATICNWANAQKKK